MRVAFISTHPAPYRDAFIARFVRTPDAVVRVFSLFPNDRGHDFWKLEVPDYKAAVLAQYSEPRWKLMWRLLRKFVFTRQYDLVFWPGFFCFYLKIPILFCGLVGKRYAFSADSVKQPPIGRIGFLVKRFLVRHAAFIFVPGEAGAKFFTETFGISREKIVMGAYALDGEVLEKKIDGFRREREAIRQKLQLTLGDTVFLMVANMIKTRYYPITAAAFVRFSSRHPGVKFVMVGRGPDMEAMQELTKTHDCLRVIPGCSFEEMLKLYAAADVYVHGGTEPSSTALVIGAIAKLPVISSPAVGCYYDVVRDEESGVAVVNHLDSEEWTLAFEKIVTLRDQWHEMGERARQLSAVLDVDNAVSMFVQAVRRACK